jgi:hypothetical protein
VFVIDPRGSRILTISFSTILRSSTVGEVTTTIGTTCVLGNCAVFRLVGPPDAKVAPTAMLESARAGTPVKSGLKVAIGSVRRVRE